jgi:hypothetical protein
MNDISLTFRIAVNADRKTILKSLKRLFKELNTVSENAKKIEVNENHVEIYANEDYDSDLALTDEDGFLYYESNVDFYPFESNVSLDDQISLARRIESMFKEDSIKAETVSEFEHLL